MPGPHTPAEVKQARVERVKELIRTHDTQVSHVNRIKKEFNVSTSTACVYLAEAREQIGDAIPVTDAHFDALFVEALLAIANDPTVKASERRKNWEVLAKFKGRFKQLEGTAPPIPAPLLSVLQGDPARLESLRAAVSTTDPHPGEPGLPGPDVPVPGPHPQAPGLSPEPAPAQ